MWVAWISFRSWPSVRSLPTESMAASATPPPIYWRQTLFSIPFHVERPPQPGQEAVQVQLHVSERPGPRIGTIGGSPRRTRDTFFSGPGLTANTGSMSARSTVPVRSVRKARMRPS